MLTRLAGWRHSGFHVFCGKRIVPNDKASLERLAYYIIQRYRALQAMKVLRERGWE
jgi:hypothetical protein